MFNMSSLQAKDQQQSFRPLINSTVDQFLADHHPATVQVLFQMTDVFELLTICHVCSRAILSAVKIICETSRNHLWLQYLANNISSMYIIFCQILKRKNLYFTGSSFKFTTSKTQCIFFQNTCRLVNVTCLYLYKFCIASYADAL